MTENIRWENFWLELQSKVKAKQISQAQYHAMMALWNEASKVVPNLRKPSIEASVSEPGGYYFSWSFTTVPHEVITVDIDPNGNYEWFYWNSLNSSNTCEGSGQLKTFLQAMSPFLKSFSEK